MLSVAEIETTVTEALGVGVGLGGVGVGLGGVGVGLGFRVGDGLVELLGEGLERGLEPGVERGLPDGDGPVLGLEPGSGESEGASATESTTCSAALARQALAQQM